MPSNLAAQLARSVSANANLLSETGRKKHAATASYLFSSSTNAQTEDLESIHALAINALAQLRLRFSLCAQATVLDPQTQTGSILFSAAAKDTDRTLLTKEQARSVDEALRKCLLALAPCLLDSITGRVIEWLVRRFRINEFNIQEVLTVFLPYHESPHFAKMISIMSIGQNSPWAFLVPLKSSGTALPRTILAGEMLKNRDVARFVVELLPSAYPTLDNRKNKQGGMIHRALISFNTAIVLEYIMRARSSDLDAGCLAFLLPALLSTLRTESLPEYVSRQTRKDAILGSYVLLSALSQKCNFTAPALEAMVSFMVDSAANEENAVEAAHLVTALVSILTPQDALLAFPASVVQKLLGINEFTSAVRAAVSWTGLSKLLIPLLTYILKSKDSAFVDFLITTEGIPSDAINYLCEHLLRNSLTEEGDETSPVWSSVLAIIQQRQPDIFAHNVEKLSSDSDSNPSTRLKLEQVVFALSAVTGSSHSVSRNILVGSTDSDPSVRSASVRRILDTLAETISSEEEESLRKAIVNRLTDSNISVIEALYSTPARMIPTLSDLGTLNSLASSLVFDPPSRAVLRAHLSFLFNHLYPANPSLELTLILNFVLPHALYTKPRSRTAIGVWEVIGESTLKKHKLLRGVCDEIRLIMDKNGEEGTSEKRSLSVEDMVKLNEVVSNKLAENIRASDDYAAIIDWLVTGLRNEDGHKRVMCHLIVRALLRSLTGDHQIEAACRVVETIQIQADNASGHGLYTGDNGAFSSAKFEDVVNRNAIAKPNSHSTTRGLQLAFLIDIPTIPRPVNAPVDWLSSDKGKNPRGHRFVYLLHLLYSKINSGSFDSFAAVYTCRRLFEAIGSESLLFLASVIVDNQTPAGETDKNLKDTLDLVALRHALAFIRSQSTEKPLDLQIFLPVLVYAVQSNDKRVRSGAVECLRDMSKQSSAGKPAAIYAYDQVYGSASGTLQYLDWADVRRYFNAFALQAKHFAGESDYILLFHNRLLSASDGEGRKGAKARQRIICYLLSHVLSCPILKVKLAILRSLKEVSDRAKLQMLLPVITELEISGRGADSEEADELDELVLCSFDSSTAKDLGAEEDARPWSAFVSVLESCLKLSRPSRRWSVLANNLRNGLFEGLSQAKKIDICLLALRHGTVQDESKFGIKALLSSFLEHSSVVRTLLHHYLRVIGDEHGRAAKRARTDPLSAPFFPSFSFVHLTSDKSSESNNTTVSESINELTLLLEILSSLPLEGSLDLVSTMMELLNRVVSKPELGKSEINYVVQLLMTCIGISAINIKELPNTTPNAIRLDILVEIMRTSDNPQTNHQALLLMSSLARLSPESIIHNVMPIFTFMGSNVFHRDDSYSFKVVQKTVESIVPVVSASLKERHTSPLDLYIASRDLLRTFTDASNHVPRHRRTTFFTHLVNVLDPAEFLAPVTMLLVDRVSSRIAKQPPQDAQSTLSLTLTILQHFEVPLQLKALKETSAEIKRLVRLVLDPEASAKNFLEESVGEDPGSRKVSRRKQVTSLLIYIGHAMRQMNLHQLDQQHDVYVQEVLSTLLSESVETEYISNVEMGEVRSSAQWSLLKSLENLSAADFVVAALSLLKSNDQTIQRGALDLLAVRVPSMTDEARKDLSPRMVEILTQIKQVLQSNEVSLLPLCTRALRSISPSARSQEESVLVDVIPLLIKNAGEESVVIYVMAALSALISKMGPRSLPYLRSVIETCVTVLKNFAKVHRDDVMKEALSTLSNLLKAIPTFWGLQEAKSVSALYINGTLKSDGALASSIDSFVKLLTKEISSKVLLAALVQSWPASVGSTDLSRSMKRFFELLGRCLRVASRSEVLENLRTLFSKFLESFSTRAEFPSEDVETMKVEDTIISAFTEVVVKLNDTSFQPLFRHLVDWAFGENSTNEKKTTFFRLYCALVAMFKEIITPYMSMLLVHFTEVLNSFTQGETDRQLWASSLETLSKTFEVDDGAFWRDDRLRTISASLISQINVCIDLKFMQEKTLTSQTLTSMMGCTDDQAIAKALNLGILMHTRSDNARLRLYALQCAVAIWQGHGKKLRSFGPETAAFIVECAEDENDDVVRECHKLKSAVEAETGKIEGL